MYDDSEKAQQRFWAKTKENPITGCIEWTARKVGGYGHFSSFGKKVYAHRYAMQVFVQPIPDGMQVLHKCDNPCCVNVDHLFLGTHADNMRDRAQKGRYNLPSGEQHYNAKLTEQQVAEIRQLYVPYSRTHGTNALAEMYGVAQSLVSYIVNNKSWAK